MELLNNTSTKEFNNWKKGIFSLNKCVVCVAWLSRFLVCLFSCFLGLIFILGIFCWVLIHLFLSAPQHRIGAIHLWCFTCASEPILLYNCSESKEINEKVIILRLHSSLVNSIQEWRASEGSLHQILDVWKFFV